MNKYDIYFISWSEKMYISFVASHFGMNMAWFLLFISSGTFLGIPNTFYHKYFGYVTVLAQLKKNINETFALLRVPVSSVNQCGLPNLKPLSLELGLRKY